MPSDDILLADIEVLGLVENTIKREQTLGNLQKADENLSRINDVRISWLPPAVVAAARHIGVKPEMHANFLLVRFVRESRLHIKKPDLRRFGFNHPNPAEETGFHDYEAWVTVPEDLENLQLDRLMPVTQKEKFE